MSKTTRPPLANNELPDGWMRVRLPQVADIIMGQSPPGSTYNAEGEGLPFFQGKAEFGDRYPTVRKWCSAPTKIAEAGDVLISIRAPVGPTNVADRTCAIGRGLAAIRPLAGIPTDFLLHAIRIQEDDLASRGTGSTFTAINREHLDAIEVPIPPLAEQRRIVAKVEALLACVNAARTRLAKVPAIVKRFRQSILTAACFGKLTEDWREGTAHLESGSALVERIIQARVLRSRAEGDERPKSGSLKKRDIAFDSDLPEIPESWCWATWDDLTDWITYGFTRPMPHVQEGIPIVTARHIVESAIDFSTVDFTTKQAFGELSKKDKPRLGEILLTKDGSIGRAAIVETSTRFCVNQSVAVLRLGGLSADTKYLLRAIEFPITRASCSRCSA